MTPAPTGLDPGLLGRFRSAGERITWRDGPRTKGRRKASATLRIAHLSDEEARIEERSGAGTFALVVESGPVGALVLLLQWADRGEPNRLLTHEAGQVEGFAAGALEAVWVDGSTERALAIPLSDVVGLARYALA